MTDDMIEMDEATARRLLDGSRKCPICQEPLLYGESIIAAMQISHTECQIRAVLGDVAHLEGRCSCAGTDHHTPEELERSYREESLATVAWMVEHRQGRWAA